MLTAGKFLSGSLVLGTLTVLGAALIQTSNHEKLHFEGPVASVLLAQTACGRLNSINYAISAEVSPYLQNLPERTRVFVSSNATTARLQLEGMENALAAEFHFNTWLPSTKSDLLEARTGKAHLPSRTLTAKLPTVSTVSDSVNRLVEIKPAIKLAPYGH